MLSNLSKKDKALFKGCFTFDDATGAFNKAGEFDERKIKKVRLFTENDDKLLFYSGFLKEILEIIKDLKLPAEIVDKRIKLDKVEEDLRSFFPEEFSYTEHQEDALEAMLRTNCGIIKAPTSSGKSSIIIAYLKATNMKALILVSKVDLANQLYRNLKDAGLDTGLYTGKSAKDGKIVVATILSAKKVPYLSTFPLVIVDEAHHASSNSYQNFFKENPFNFRFGFSATPEGTEKFKWALTRQFLGSILYEVDAQILMENKVLAKPTIYLINHDCRATLDWVTAYEINIIRDDERNHMIRKLVEEYEVPTLIIVRYIEHGEQLNRIIDDSVFLSGSTPIEDRQQAIKDFEKGKIKTIIATSIFNEGISINAIQLLVIASAGKSDVEVAQRLGRSLRIDPKRGKYEVDVYDFYDRGNKFTERHARQRIRIYRKSGFDVVLPQNPGKVKYSQV